MTPAFEILGGIALGLLLFSGFATPFKAWLAARDRKKSLKKAEKLDWELIDNTVHSIRPRRDCERQESLGICTGRECLVYESCDFNIKKVVH